MWSFFPCLSPYPSASNPKTGETNNNMSGTGCHRQAGAPGCYMTGTQLVWARPKERAAAEGVGR